MKKIILMPDSFKGSLSAREFCAIAARVIAGHFPQCRIVSLPVADGGEGSVDCFLAALGGKKQCTEVSGPLGAPLKACYGILPDNTAVLEMAAAAGLPLLQDHLDVLHSQTFGVGQLMRAALNQGCHKLIVGLGGSCTNDGGCGAASALGARFLDARGRSFIPAGGTLAQIAAIDLSALDQRLAGTELDLMCDIDNPAYGPDGAAYIFAPQKGADEAAVYMLDQGLRHLAEVIKRDTGFDVAGLPGGGAAGAMGAGLAALCGGKLKPGIEVMLAAVDFDGVAADADLIITGEGRLDRQSLSGKVVVGVSRRAKPLNIPVLALAGSLETGFEAAYEHGLTAAFSINPRLLTLEQAMRQAPANLELSADNLCRMLKRFGY